MRNYDVRYLGILDGPSLAPASIHEPSHVMTIRSLAVAEGLIERAYLTGELGRWHTLGATTLDAQPLDSVLADRYTLTLYRVTCRILDGGPRAAWQAIIEDGDPYPDYVVKVGPRGGISVEPVA